MRWIPAALAPLLGTTPDLDAASLKHAPGRVVDLIATATAG